MKRSFLNKVSKVVLLFLAISLVSGFCFQIFSMNQGHAMAMSDFSPMRGAAKNMMPCCGESSDHLTLFDLPTSKPFIQILGLVTAVASVILIVILSNFSILSYSFLAPPGPDLLLKIIKRE
jgi:hypothetical protein